MKSKIIKNIINNNIMMNCYQTTLSFKNLIKYGTTDFFKSVQIETSTACNRRCLYCPNSKYGTKNEFMTEETFNRIISELKSINYTGVVNFGFFNEPIMDKRLFELVLKLKSELPSVFIRVFTNGDMLNELIVKNLIDAGVNLFHITNHDKDTEKFNAKFIPIAKRFGSKVILSGNLHDKHMNFAGEIDSGSSMNYCKNYKTLMITYNGDSVLCCWDYHRNHVMGNINNSKIMDIWNSAKYRTIRKGIKSKTNLLPFCKKCMRVGDSETSSIE